MSNALAISGVTAVLQYCLNLIYTSPLSPFGLVTVSALAPDIVQGTVGNAPGPALQVNLFLHQVTINAAWRNNAMPALAADGVTRLTVPPLALDLHYLLTAYAGEDTMAEALLGFAVMLLHNNPILPRALIRTALANVPHGNPLWNSMVGTGLADQIEMIKITPASVGREEMAWLWTALKADYRPTFPFQVSVVLITPPLPISFSLPVLMRNITAQAGLPPQLFSAQPPNQQTASAPGDLVTLTGKSLGAATLAAFTNGRQSVDYTTPLTAGSITDIGATFTVPDDPPNLPAGIYDLALLFTVAGGAITNSTSTIQFPLSPALLPFSPGAAANNAAGTLVTASFKPQARPNQSVSLALASMTPGAFVSASAPALPFGTAAGTLTFQFPTLPPGPYLARLQVDGVFSPVTVQWTPAPPVFQGPVLNV